MEGNKPGVSGLLVMSHSWTEYSLICILIVADGDGRIVISGFLQSQPTPSLKPKSAALDSHASRSSM